MLVRFFKSRDRNCSKEYFKKQWSCWSNYMHAHQHNCCAGSCSQSGSSKTVNGSATFSDQMFDALTVNGLLRADDVTLKQLVVNGSAAVEDCVITIATINGSLTAKDTTFQERLTVMGSVELIDSRLRDIVIKDAGNWWSGTMVLRCNTVVSGSITFESGKGSVILHDAAQINGAVVGAEVIRR